MERRRISFSKREKYFAKIDRLNDLAERKRRLYNRYYHRSLIYVSTLVVRIAFILFFTWIFFFHGGSGDVSKEVVLSKESQVFVQKRSMKVTKLYITTDVDTYEAHFETGMPSVRPGDTLLIEHNIFGKPTFFGSDDWSVKYELWINWVLYLTIGIVNVVSFSFNDGLDRFTDKILWVAWTVDLFGFVYYFLN